MTSRGDKTCDLLGLARTSLLAVDDGVRTGLVGDFRHRWPDLAATPWFAAVGDGAAAVVGSDCTDGRRAALTIGTSAAVRVLAPAPAAPSVPPALFAYLLDGERAVVGGARSNAGNLVRWATDLLHLKGDDLVEAATTGRQRGGHGLQASAALAGERSPDWPLDARAELAGLRRDTTALDILQALLEDAASGLARTVAALDDWVGGPVTLVLSGGGSTSVGWQRLVADACGRPPEAGPEQASLLGAARLVVQNHGA